MDPIEIRERLTSLGDEVALLRRKLTSISPASDEWARVGHLVDGLRTELEAAEAEAEKAQNEARGQIDLLRRGAAADAREILARAELEAAEKMAEAGELAEPILAVAREQASVLLDEALGRVRETINITGIDLDELSGEFELATPVSNTVLDWLKEADPQAAARSRTYAEEAPTAPPAAPQRAAGSAGGFHIGPIDPEGDFLRYHVTGEFTFASLLALEHAVARLPGARGVSIAPAAEGGAILSLMSAEPTEMLRKLQTIPDFPLYV